MKRDSDTTIRELKDLFRDFVHEREWENYHHPKDLAEAICVEAAELLEIFQWICKDEALRFKDDPEKSVKVADELADVLMYCLSLSDVMAIDVTQAVLRKMKKDEKKYPVEKFRGMAK